jgi:serine/threonine protein kinase
MAKDQESPSKSSRSDMLQTSTFFASRFRIIRSLGQGDMGKVYLASDLMLGEEQIALKILSSDLEADPNHLARFLREVQLTRQVTHPTVVRTFDIGTHGDCHFFTMEYVEGQTLAATIASQPLELEKAIDIISQLCDGLIAIHSTGIVHRDLKSSNVMITADGKIKIADFGIAHHDANKLGETEELLGSATHMAPEVWKQSDISNRSDLYSLGVIIYEILTGKLPFNGKTAYELMWKHLKDFAISPIEVNPKVPAWLSSLTVELLSKDPKDRPESAKHVLNTVQQHSKPRKRAEVVLPKIVAENQVDIWAPRVPESVTRYLSSIEDRDGLDFFSEPSTLDQNSTSNGNAKHGKLSELKEKLLIKILGRHANGLLILKSKRGASAFFATLLALIVLVLMNSSQNAILDILFSGDSPLREMCSHLVSAVFLSLSLLLPFFCLCTAIEGVKSGLVSYLKLSVASFMIFIALFGYRISEIHEISPSKDSAAQMEQVNYAAQSVMKNYSEILTFQVSPTAFKAQSEPQQQAANSETPASASILQRSSHLIFLFLLTVFACQICCGMNLELESNFRTRLYFAPVIVAFLCSLAFGAGSSSNVWEFSFGAHQISTTQTALFSALLVWTVIYACVSKGKSRELELLSQPII